MAAGIGLLAGGLFLRGTASQQGTPAPPSVTLLLTLGQKTGKVEKWDGTARVSGGSLVATEGRHFSGGDSVTGPGQWKCVTRRDEVAPYADIHYTEMRPGDKPEVLFHPVGVFLTLRPAAATRVDVETAQGNFDFALDDIKDDTPSPCWAAARPSAAWAARRSFLLPNTKMTSRRSRRCRTARSRWHGSPIKTAPIACCSAHARTTPGPRRKR